MKPTIVLYTHTDVKDVWLPFFGQTEKWLGDYKKVILVNKDDEVIPADYKRIFYNDTKIYRERLITCLEQLDDELIIFHHEDMFLYNKPDLNRIELYSDYLINSNESFIKLIRGGIQVGIDNNSYSDLKKIDATFEYIFAIQPVIWKTNKLLEVVKYSGGNTIWEFEVAAQKTCRERNIFGYYVDDNGNQRGGLHWDSKIYPYVATAVIKGKWNTREYPNELKDIFQKYNIDLSVRQTNG